MILDWILLIVGMALLIKGADFFVDGASKIAKAFHIPSLIIGLTLVSMGTSAPELSVSLNAALNGSNEISLGNVVGSNLCNTLLILGISAIFTPLLITKDMKKYDIPIMFGIYALMVVFAFFISPEKLDRVESIILLVLFVGYLVFLVLRAKKDNQNKETEEEEEKISKGKLAISVVLALVGLAAIIFGGDLVVDSASNIAMEFGMSETLVGLTIVAVGTSLPELVTSVVAAIKKENDIAVGNVIGSNIFNVLLILGTTSTIAPLVIGSAVMIDLLILLCTGLLAILVSQFFKDMKRWHGIVFLALYVAYIAYIIIRG